MDTLKAKILTIIALNLVRKIFLFTIMPYLDYTYPHDISNLWTPLKKIKNILSTFSSPPFTVHNPTSKDVFYTACLLYRAMCRVVYERGNW